jgi:hypothetical protein
MAKHIIENNHGKRPVYYAATVPMSNASGYDKYFRMDGLAFRVTKYAKEKNRNDIKYLEKNFNKFRFRSILDEDGNPVRDVYRTDTEDKLIGNYLIASLSIAEHYVNQIKKLSNKIELSDSLEIIKENSLAKALYYINLAKKFKPNDFIPGFRELELYQVLGDKDKVREVAINIYENADKNDEELLLYLSKKFHNLGFKDLEREILTGMIKRRSKLFDPYAMLYYLQLNNGDTSDAKSTLLKWFDMHPDDSDIQKVVRKLEKMEKRGQ